MPRQSVRARSAAVTPAGEVVPLTAAGSSTLSKTSSQPAALQPPSHGFDLLRLIRRLRQAQRLGHGGVVGRERVRLLGLEPPDELAIGEMRW